MWNSKSFTSLCCTSEHKFRAQERTVPSNGYLSRPTCHSWTASSELCNPLLPPRLQHHPDYFISYWYYPYLLSFSLISCVLSDCMLVQFSVKLSCVDRGLSRLCDYTVGKGNSHIAMWGLWRNLMSYICELSRSTFRTAWERSPLMPVGGKV